MRQNELKTTLILTSTCKYFPCALKVLFNEEIEDSNYIYHPYP